MPTLSKHSTTWSQTMPFLPIKQVDLLTLKVVSESRVTWATSMPILVFLSLSVLDLGSMYATDRQTSDKTSLNASALWGRRHNNRPSHEHVLDAYIAVLIVLVRISPEMNRSLCQLSFAMDVPGRLTRIQTPAWSPDAQSTGLVSGLYR